MPAALLAACCSALASTVLATQGPAPSPALNASAAIQVSQGVVGNTLGAYTLTDTAGRRVPLSSYRGKPLLVNFIYTGCFQVCPTARFRLVQKPVAVGDRG